MLATDKMKYFDELLNSALMINDRLRVEEDHVTFTDSMNEAEDFKEVVNRLWHIRSGWRDAL